MKAQSSKGGSKIRLKNKYNAVKNSTNPKRTITTPAQAQKKKSR
jgi:hypothetical protein